MLNTEVAGHSKRSEVHAVDQTPQLRRVFQLLSTQARSHSLGLLFEMWHS